MQGRTDGFWGGDPVPFHMLNGGQGHILISIVQSCTAPHIINHVGSYRIISGSQKSACGGSIGHEISDCLTFVGNYLFFQLIHGSNWVTSI